MKANQIFHGFLAILLLTLSSGLKTPFDSYNPKPSFHLEKQVVNQTSNLDSIQTKNNHFTIFNPAKYSTINVSPFTLSFNQRLNKTKQIIYQKLKSNKLKQLHFVALDCYDNIQKHYSISPERPKHCTS